MYPVLIVEDEMWIRNALSEMVTNIGDGFIVVGEAQNGAEAWEMIPALWPSLILTDIMMPHRDGLWLVRQIAEQALPIKTIIISGYDNFRYAQQALQYDVTEYLLKPAAEEDLRKALLHSVRKLERIKDIHDHAVQIKQFVEQLHSADPLQLANDMGALLQRIDRLKQTNPGARAGLLRMLASRLLELLRHAGVPQPERAEDLHGIARARLEELLQAWIKVRATDAIGDMKHVIKLTVDYIDKHYMEDLTLPKIAEVSHLSISHFTALFKQNTGTSFVAYLNKVRVDKAKQLLLEPDLKIYETAEMVGFASLPHFNRVFKSLVGLTPNEYRKGMGL